MLLDGKTAVSLRNVDRVREHLFSVVGPHELKARDRSNMLDFWHKSAGFGEFTFNEFAYGRDIVYSAELPSDFYIIIFTISGHVSVHSRSRDFVTSADTVLVMTHDRVEGCVSADCRQLLLRIDAGSLHRYLQQFHDIVVDVPLEFAFDPCSRSKQTPELHEMVSMICRTLSRERTSFNDARIRRSIEQALIGVLLHEIPHNYTPTMLAGQHLPVPRSVKAAKNYIHAHAREPISLHEIASAASVSPRALQAGFRYYLEVTPRMYLRNVRLDLAHAELTRGGTGELNVTDIALRCGFTDLSKFAQYYRQRFGRHPSSTLRFGRH